MRLTKLKLAGFKSFVDPTHIDLPGQLVGVVGPNGCGKSNIMDAVRWVLGESKASELRGESMQDVIFNGTTERKPVARASVELIFDNSLGRASGQWSQYAELSVKRVLTRDGQSDYLINNLKVRRKDITDLFLGTGLGPRAYAIIGQGMITRIIEAKPDELRVFLEEAAGVSKYKERRKETEGRLADTRENLTRVDDIRQELAGRIEHLDVQAEVARRYHELNNDLTRKQQLLWLSREREAEAERVRTSQEVEQAATDLEARIAGLREIEARLEESREAHFAASETLHKTQAGLYEANAEVVRLETELRHQRDLRRSAEARLTQLESEGKEWREQALRGEGDETRWQELQALADMRVEQGVERLEIRQDQLPQAETAQTQAQEGVSRVRADLMRQEQTLQVQQTHRTHADRALESMAQRRERLQTEKAGLSSPDAHALSDAQMQKAMFDEQAAEAELMLENMQEALNRAQEAKEAAQAAAQQAERRHTELAARKKALAQVQSRAEGQGRLDEWLKKHGLDTAVPLWKQLEVEAGWEDAVEAVLRERLKAVAAGENGEHLAGILRDPPKGKQTLWLAASGAQAAEPIHPAGDTLLSRIRITPSAQALQPVLVGWLHGVRIVASLEEGFARRDELGAGESFICPAGHSVSRNDIAFFAADTAEHGLLERQRELESLEAGLQAAEQALEQVREQLAEAQGKQTTAQEALQNERRRLQEISRQRHEQELLVLKLTQAVERFNERAVRLDGQLADLMIEEEGESERRIQAEEAIAVAREAIGLLQVALSDARGVLEAAERRLRDEREAVAQIERELSEARFSQRECAAKLEEIVKNRRLARGQSERIDAELEECRIRLQDTVPEVLEPKLDEALAMRVAREEALSQDRQMLEMAAATVSQLDETRLKSEREVEPLRERIGELKLKQQAAALNAEQMARQLLEAGADKAALEGDLVNVRSGALQGEITRLQKAVAELGAVNLAALEELETARERAGYLDNQAADLNLAMETLESAIRRIDKETRELLKHTFDTVNSHFGELFPALFGGGRAELVMTGDEILDAGVQVVAQPPGKKNSTIHLLSGGEKALTAIALVFSIFQLNPAPFCLLDEVDAPLDDSNTERFCSMVKKMSAQTQFLFISHNKIAMEMAEQLVGVTMQEFGVSRIVEVDMDDALRMRESA